MPPIEFIELPVTLGGAMPGGSGWRGAGGAPLICIGARGALIGAPGGAPIGVPGGAIGLGAMPPPGIGGAPMGAALAGAAPFGG